MTGTGFAEHRLAEHVERLADEHPPIELGSVDYTIRQPQQVAERFGPVLNYMARVELEVERNVLELTTLLPDPPAIDKHFYADVWMPQEIQHGIILDRLQLELGLPAAEPDLTTISFRLRLLGALGRIGAVQDVSRMLYYLTGMATERSAVLAYNDLHAGLLQLDERAIADTLVGQIRRQEPGHFAYYRLAATSLWSQLAGWQKWLVRTLRRHTFAPVGVDQPPQMAQFGTVLTRLGAVTADDADAAQYAAQVARIEYELLWARNRGLRVPTYVADAFRRAVQAAQHTSEALKPPWRSRAD